MEIIARDEPIETRFVPTPEPGNSRELVDFQSSQSQEQWQIAGVIVQKPRIIRLYRCFGCDRNFAPLKMSTCLSVCRDCLQKFRNLKAHTQQRFLDRTIARIRDFLRRAA